MAKLQRALLEQIDKPPEVVLQRILRRKLVEAGIEIPPAAFDALIDHVLRQGGDVFTWTDAKTGEEAETVRKLTLSFGDKDIEEIQSFTSEFEARLPALINTLATEGAATLFRTLKERWTIEGAVQRYELDGFRERMEERWGEGLNLLRMLLTCCRELGNEAFKRYRRTKSKKHACRRFVLVRLHARACQVADEIITLLENGFADGAMARWRTLHELAVVATLIEEGDEQLAERYIAHNAVDVKRQADDYDETQVPFGYPPIGPRSRRDIEKAYAHAIKRYGPAFATPYGWATERLHKKKVTFKDLQEEAGRSGMNPYYKLASFSVHAGSRAMFFRLTDMGKGDILLAGRSNSGLVEPGQNTAYALLQITSALLGKPNNLDQIIEMGALFEIRDAIPKAFARAERKLRREEAALKREQSRRAHRHKSQVRPEKRMSVGDGAEAEGRKEPARRLRRVARDSTL